jgi:hypothetical protein
MEVMRRWEDVREKGWLTAAQKETLKSSTQEHHLYLNEKGEYELHEIAMLPPTAKAKDARAFLFARNSKRVLAYWHMSGAGKLAIARAGGKTEEVALDKLRYLEFDMPAEGVKAAYAAAEQRAAQ